jgi:hypothetical protein
LAISFFFMLWIMFMGKPFFWVMFCIFYHSFFFAWSVMGVLAFCLCKKWMRLVCDLVDDVKCIELWYLHLWAFCFKEWILHELVCIINLTILRRLAVLTRTHN